MVKVIATRGTYRCSVASLKRLRRVAKRRGFRVSHILDQRKSEVIYILLLDPEFYV